VTWVQVVLNYVVSSGDDGSVKLWDLNKGDFIRNLVKLESNGSGGKTNITDILNYFHEKLRMEAYLKERAKECFSFERHL
jgi:WD40 repeat protein